MSSQPYTTRHFKSTKSIGNNPVNISLFVGNEAFMFARFSQNFKEVYDIHHIGFNESMNLGASQADQLNFLFSNYQLLNQNYTQVFISVLNNNFTIVPEAFAEKEHFKEVFNFSLGEQPKNILTHQFNNISFSYFADRELMQLLESSFKNASIRHAGAVAVDLLFNNRSLKNCNVLLNFSHNAFELLAKDEHRLLYYNLFNYETAEDVLYYLLFMMEQFDLSPEKTQLMLAGQIDADSDLFRNVKRFVRNVGFAAGDSSLSQSLAELKIPEHYYFTLLNQHLCEL